MSTIHQAASIRKGRRKKIRLNSLKSFLGAPQKKGIVFKIRIMTPKKPNSAKRKVVRIKLSTRYWVTAKIKGQGHNLQAFSQVLVCGGRANDLPGVRYNMVKGKFSFSWQERILRAQSRSKYGITREDYEDLYDTHITRQFYGDKDES